MNDKRILNIKTVSLFVILLYIICDPVPSLAALNSPHVSGLVSTSNVSSSSTQSSQSNSLLQSVTSDNNDDPSRIVGVDILSNTSLDLYQSSSPNAVSVNKNDKNINMLDKRDSKLSNSGVHLRYNIASLGVFSLNTSLALNYKMFNENLVYHTGNANSALDFSNEINNFTLTSGLGVSWKVGEEFMFNVNASYSSSIPYLNSLQKFQIIYDNVPYSIQQNHNPVTLGAEIYYTPM